MSSIYGIRSICGRIIVRMTYEHGATISEMTLDEAKVAHAILGRAIDHLEFGDTMAEDLPQFIAAMRLAWPAPKPC